VTDEDKQDERLQKLVCCISTSTSMPYGFCEHFFAYGT